MTGRVKSSSASARPGWVTTSSSRSSSVTAIPAPVRWSWPTPSSPPSAACTGLRGRRPTTSAACRESGAPGPRNSSLRSRPAGARSCARAASASQILAAIDAAQLLVPQFGALPVEHFGLLLLDTKHRVTRTTLLSVGTLDASIVHPREVFRAATSGGAAAIVLFHNHPVRRSGAQRGRHRADQAPDPRRRSDGDQRAGSRHRRGEPLRQPARAGGFRVVGSLQFAVGYDWRHEAAEPVDYRERTNRDREPRTANCKLQTANCKLQTTRCYTSTASPARRAT